MDENHIPIGYAAHMLGFSPRWLAVLADRGDVPVYKAPSGRRYFKLSEIQEYRDRIRVRGKQTSRRSREQDQQMDD